MWGWLKGAAGSVYALAFHIGCELVKGVLHGLGDLAGKVGGYLVKGVKSGLEHVGHVFGIGSPSKWAGPAYRQAARRGHPRRFEQGIGRFGSWPVRRSRAR